MGTCSAAGMRHARRMMWAKDRRASSVSAGSNAEMEKENINGQLLRAIKETAMDCRIYKQLNAAENLVCYGEGVNIESNEFGTFPSWDEDLLVREDINLRQEEVKPVKIILRHKAGANSTFCFSSIIMAVPYILVFEIIFPKGWKRGHHLSYCMILSCLNCFAIAQPK